MRNELEHQSHFHLMYFGDTDPTLGQTLAYLATIL